MSLSTLVAVRNHHKHGGLTNKDLFLSSRDQKSEIGVLTWQAELWQCPSRAKWELCSLHPLTWAPIPSKSNYAPRGPPPNIIPLGVKASTYELEGDEGEWCKHSAFSIKYTNRQVKSLRISPLLQTPSNH